MLLFASKLKKLADKETRVVTVLRKDAYGSLPPGSYVFIESYCEEKNCDCRRVMISVLGEDIDKILATISMGFDLEGYDEGPFLDPLNIQSKHSKDLMKLFLHVINTDPDYAARLQRHYVLFKEKIEGKPYRGKPFETPGLVERVEKPIRIRDIFKSKPVSKSISKPGRNEPCPCGSGKKYKQCCMASSKEDENKGPGKQAAQASPRKTGKKETEATGEDTVGKEDLEEARLLISYLEESLRLKRPDPVADQYIDKVIKENPLLAFPLLQLLLEDLAPDGTSREMSPTYQACMVLLGHTLTEIRFSVERNRQWAIDAARLIQEEIADRAFKVEVDVRVQSDLVQALHDAKLEVHPGIKAKSEEIAEYYGRFTMHKGAPDLDSLFDAIVAEGPDNSFSMLEHLTAELDLLPLEGHLGTAVQMAGARNPLIRELAALMLLHENHEVRVPLPAFFMELVDPKNFSPVTLRRMIGIRNWVLPAERPPLDALIKKVRAAQVECAPMPPVQRVKIHASPFDGSGVQGIWNIVGKKGGHRFLSVLLKQTWGIRDVTGIDQLARKEVEAILHDLDRSTMVETIEQSYMDRALSHFIHLGQQQGKVPRAGLVYVAEAMGSEYWTPRELVMGEEIAALEESVNPRYLTPENISKVLKASRSWPERERFASSWFEDDSRVDTILQSIPGLSTRSVSKKLGQATKLILDEIIEDKYNIWAERLLWMALWAKACRNPSPLPWEDFFIVAREFSRGTPLNEIPLLVAAAERSVYSGLQRMKVLPK